jgi:hypothetical protein
MQNWTLDKVIALAKALPDEPMPRGWEREVLPFPGKPGYRVAYWSPKERFFGRPDEATQRRFVSQLMGVYTVVNGTGTILLDPGATMVAIDRKGLVSYYTNVARRNRSYINVEAVFKLGTPVPRDPFHRFLGGLYQQKNYTNWKPKPATVDVATVRQAVELLAGEDEPQLGMGQLFAEEPQVTTTPAPPNWTTPTWAQLRNVTANRLRRRG